MTMDICVDCGFVHQSVGDLRYMCPKCDRVTFHVILPHCSVKEDKDLDNFYAYVSSLL